MAENKERELYELKKKHAHLQDIYTIVLTISLNIRISI